MGISTQTPGWEGGLRESYNQNVMDIAREGGFHFRESIFFYFFRGLFLPPPWTVQRRETPCHFSERNLGACKVQVLYILNSWDRGSP